MTALRLDHVDVRPVLVPLRRPVVSRVGIYEQWPLILIDLHTEQGVIGRSYLAPYLRQAVRYIVPAIHDLAAARQGKAARAARRFRRRPSGRSAWSVSKG